MGSITLFLIKKGSRLIIVQLLSCKQSELPPHPVSILLLCCPCRWAHLLAIIKMIEDDGYPNSQQDKGLFTFYREQAEYQQQLKLMRKRKSIDLIGEPFEYRKIVRASNIDLTQLEKIQQEQRQQERIRMMKESEILRKQKEKKDKLAEKGRQKMMRQLHEPKHVTDRIVRRHRLGGSVIIINGKDERPLQLKYDIMNLKSPHESQKGTLKKIEEMINQGNNNRYFLQNKQLPSQFGNSSLEKEMLKKSPEEVKTERVSLPQSYFNQYGNSLSLRGNEKKRLPLFSYEKLPQIIQQNQSSTLKEDTSVINSILGSFHSGRRYSHLVRLSPKRNSVSNQSLLRMKREIQVLEKQEKIHSSQLERPLNQRQKKLIEIIGRSQQSKSNAAD